MKTLIVGAGAVGQTYAHYLLRAGAEVTFLVKPAHVDEVRRGLTVHELRLGRAPRAHGLVGARVVTTAEEAGAERPDQVWLCVSSTAIRGGWLEDLLRATRESTVVALQPGIDDKRYLTDRCPTERLVRGVITFIAYQSPLPGLEGPEGIAFWAPPLTRGPFDGPPEVVRAVVGALRKGGYPAAHVRGGPEAAAFGSAVLIPLVALLEAEGWSFARLAASRQKRLWAAAARQAIDVAASELGLRRPLWRVGLGPVLLRVATWLAPRLLPLPLEPYLAYHFTKVGDQTRLMLRTYVEKGTSRGASVAALEDLLALLPPR